MEIKRGLFVEPGDDDVKDRVSLLGEHIAYLKKTPTEDEPCFTLDLYRPGPLVKIRAFIGQFYSLNDDPNAVIVTSSDLRGDKIVFKDTKKRDHLLELGRSVEEAFEIQP